MKKLAVIGTRPERRAKPRARVSLQAEYRVLTLRDLARGRKRLARLSARVKNLGAGGVLLRVHRRLARRSVLSLALALPERQAPVRSLAEVKHVREVLARAHYPYAVGLEFLAISPGDTAAVRRFVSRRAGETPGNSGKR